MEFDWSTVAIIMGLVITAFVAGMALIILWRVFTGRINLDWLIAEPDSDGKASLSRFQFLIFTFVIAGVYLLLCIEAGTLIDVPEHVLWLLGISGGSYTVSKGIKTWGESAVGMKQAEAGAATQETSIRSTSTKPKGS